MSIRNLQSFIFKINCIMTYPDLIRVISTRQIELDLTLTNHEISEKPHQSHLDGIPLL